MKTKMSGSWLELDRIGKKQQQQIIIQSLAQNKAWKFADNI